ncbi:hypothetical protein KUTeg_009214 [Tegillarca granosa]|uniref:Uncharacterized protein n=1 Tax=Tegillarca granosa TaxID=220873 RepID=A0ABQ9FA74_TEGGR|nr:hypothetical protein KUTeg_009214 [Tegillarca granosa]
MDDKEICELELSTREQTNSATWHIARKHRLTASNFYKIGFRRKQDSSNLLNDLLYRSVKKNKAMVFSLEQEESATSKFITKMKESHASTRFKQRKLRFLDFGFVFEILQLGAEMDISIKCLVWFIVLAQQSIMCEIKKNTPLSGTKPTLILFYAPKQARKKSQQQGVYKDNPNVPFSNEDLRNNPYRVFDNPSEPESSNDGSIQFSNPLTGIEQPSSNIYSESSIQPTFSVEGATGRGVQFSNLLCFVDDVYVSVSDKKPILPDDECDDPQTFHLMDISEETLTFSPNEKDEGFENVQSENS